MGQRAQLPYSFTSGALAMVEESYEDVFLIMTHIPVNQP